MLLLLLDFHQNVTCVLCALYFGNDIACIVLFLLEHFDFHKRFGYTIRVLLCGLFVLFFALCVFLPLTLSQYTG